MLGCGKLGTAMGLITMPANFRAGDTNRGSRNFRIPVFAAMTSLLAHAVWHSVKHVVSPNQTNIYTYIYLKLPKHSNSNTISRENRASLLIMPNFKIKRQRDWARICIGMCIYMFCNAILQQYALYNIYFITFNQ